MHGRCYNLNILNDIVVQKTNRKMQGMHKTDPFFRVDQTRRHLAKKKTHPVPQLTFKGLTLSLLTLFDEGLS